MDLLRGVRARLRRVVAEDAPGRSNLAIAQRRARSRTELRAHVYLYDGRRIVISSVMSVPGSLIHETDDVTVLDAAVPDAALGQAICAHLLRHVSKSPPNLRNKKRTDWAAFRASGARSVRDFERNSFPASVETVGLFLDISAAPVLALKPQINVQIVAQAEHGELGARVREAIRAAQVLQDAGIV